MSVIRKMALCACFVFVGCNENDHDNIAQKTAPITVPTAQSIAKGTLAEGVRILSDAETASIVSNTENKITFSGAINFSPNTVVLGKDITFKVESVSFESGNTVVVSTEPRLDEIFDSLRVKGVFTALPSQVEPLVLGGGTSLGRAITTKSAVRATASSLPELTIEIPTPPDSFAWAAKVDADGIESSIKLSGKFIADTDYDYQKDKGGLQFAKLDVFSTITAVSATKVQLKKEISIERQLPSISIPIPVSIIDSALAVVGVRVVSILIPSYLGLKAEAAYGASIQGKFLTEGSLTANYNKTSGATIQANYKASVAHEPPVPVTPAGSPELTSFSGKLSLYVKSKPSLTFLNAVAMLGVESTISGEEEGVVQIVSTNPFYCLSLTPSATLSANGFFKGVGITEKTTDKITKTLYKGTPDYFGSCKAPTTVAVVSITPTTGKYGQALEIKTAVSFATKSQSTAPNSPPSGDVDIQIGTQSCKAKLTDKGTSTASGSCLLKPLQAGVSVPISLKYVGDEKYAAAMGSSVVSIDKASTFVGMTTTPNSSNSGGSVNFSASVTAMPLVDGDPTGSIEFQDAQKKSICAGAVVSGRAECSAVVTGTEPSTTKFYTAVYSGDDNFSTATSSSYAHNVNHIINGFTKISATGQKLPDSATEWSCVLDNKTGLTWEKKTNDQGLHQFDKSYDVDNPLRFPDKNLYLFVDKVKAEKLCGFSNWRLPDVLELYALIDPDLDVDPAQKRTRIYSKYFPYSKVGGIRTDDSYTNFNLYTGYSYSHSGASYWAWPVILVRD